MKIYRMIRVPLYLALAALVIVFVRELAEIRALRFFIGGLMIFYGAEEVILTAVRHAKHYDINLLYWNVIEIAIGVTIIAFVKTGATDMTYAAVCVAWAIWSILREARELAEVTEELKHKELPICRVVAFANMLESLVVIVFSLMLLARPGEHHAKIHLYLLAVELSTKVLFPLIDHIAERAAKKKKAAKAKTETAK